MRGQWVPFETLGKIFFKNDIIICVCRKSPLIQPLNTASAQVPVNEAPDSVGLQLLFIIAWAGLHQLCQLDPQPLLPDLLRGLGNVPVTVLAPGQAEPHPGSLRSVGELCVNVPVLNATLCKS